MKLFTSSAVASTRFMYQEVLKGDPEAAAVEAEVTKVRGEEKKLKVQVTEDLLSDWQKLSQGCDDWETDLDTFDAEHSGLKLKERYEDASRLAIAKAKEENRFIGEPKEDVVLPKWLELKVMNEVMHKLIEEVNAELGIGEKVSKIE